MESHRQKRDTDRSNRRKHTGSREIQTGAIVESTQAAERYRQEQSFYTGSREIQTGAIISSTHRQQKDTDRSYCRKHTGSREIQMGGIIASTQAEERYRQEQL